jgi:predicted PurR-regulated permease PerM
MEHPAALDAPVEEPTAARFEDAPPEAGAGRASRGGSVATRGLFLLAIFYTLYFARPLILPIVLALHLGFLLRPAVSGLKRIGLPEPVGAAILLIAFVAFLGQSVYLLSGPAKDWMTKLPSSFRKLEEKVRDLRRPIEGVQQMVADVKQAATQPQGAARTPEVQVKSPSVIETLLSDTDAVLAAIALTFLTLYFYLATGDLLLRKVVQVLPSLTDKKRVLEIFRETEQQVFGYLRTITLINAVLGAVLGAAFAFLGMPNPILWAVMAFLLNFVPYLGPLTGMVILSVVAGATFDTFGRALIVPGVYFLAHNLETNVLTPMIMGRKLWLNPLLLFLWLWLWFWLWGFVGALLAVPMLKMLKICCDNIPALTPIAEFLGP